MKAVGFNPTFISSKCINHRRCQLTLVLFAEKQFRVAAQKPGCTLLQTGAGAPLNLANFAGNKRTE